MQKIKIINILIVSSFFCYLFFIGGNIHAQVVPKHQSHEINISDTFPTPPENKNMMFYIQRTSNLHTVIYEANYNKDSTINEEEPLNIYWIRYPTRYKGEYMPLSTIQRKFAYGVNSTMIDKEKKTFKINLVSYKKIDFYLMNSKHDKKYHVYVSINGKMALVTKVFIKVDGGSVFNPNVIYIELTGKEIGTGKKVVERFKP